MIADILRDSESRMSKAMEALQNTLATVRTGRASPSLVEHIHVDYYGTSTPLNQLASISAPEPRTIQIQPWDKGSMAPIERAILTSDLGLTPNNDGQAIRISIPALTEDRRKQLVKVVHSMTEDSKVAVRNVRRDGIHQAKELSNSKQVSEDEERKAGSDLDALSRKYVEEAEKIGKAKEQDVLEV